MINEENRYNAFKMSGEDMTVLFEKEGQSDTMPEGGYCINLLASKINGKFVWPSDGIASMLPISDSTTGIIETNQDVVFTAYVGETSRDEYEKYIEACKEKGFNRFSKYTSSYFTAENDEDGKIYIGYKDIGMMTIDVTIER